MELSALSTSIISKHTGITGITSFTKDILHDQTHINHWSFSSSEKNLSRDQDNGFYIVDLFKSPPPTTPSHLIYSLSPDPAHTLISDNAADDWYLIPVAHVSEFGDLDSDHENSTSLTSSFSGAPTLKTDLAP